MPANAASLVAALTGALQQFLQAARPVTRRVEISVPTYSTYDDQTSANAFLLALGHYYQATGISESEVLGRIPPVALVDQAARWGQIMGHMAGTMIDFRKMFREEFLPGDYPLRTRRELELYTLAPDE